MKNKSRNEICGGCNGLDMCHIPNMKNDVECPCIICLIKPMCDQECEEFKKYCKRKVSNDPIKGVLWNS